ncbi:MAG: ABC transporter ATP-binding protein [Planctomycetes bacterium]|nr:ABC transporter ATP-binding protein [Planctomycetota bacterium]
MNWLGAPQNVLLGACAAVVLIAVLQGTFEYVSELLQAGTAHKITNTLRRQLFKHMQMLSLRFHERNRTGDLLLRLTGDITMLRELLIESLFDLIAAGITVVALLAFMFAMAPKLALISLATIPLVVLVTLLLTVKLRTAVKKAREKEGDLISIAGEVLGAIALVQAFTREEEEKERFSRLSRSTLRAGLKTVKLRSRLTRTVHIVTAIGTCGILYYGVEEVRSGRMTPGTLIVFISYFNSLLKPIRMAARTAGRMAKASSCADRVREVLQTMPEISDAPDAVEAPRFEGRIAFDNVEFAYNKQANTLHQIKLDILRGQRVALVGPTGAGKSTLVKLLLRFYDPSAGSVRFDDHDIREFTVESLRRQISVVQQETVLFGTTIGENIAMGRVGAAFDDVRAAAASLGIDDWIQSLPQGYDTKVGERGFTLSGGQRQLISLARAALRDGRILIFDEPTTGLDARTEARVRTALERAMKDRTTILISHGLRPLAAVDRVVVVQGGRIEQLGSPEELMRAQGLYRDLFGREARGSRIRPSRTSRLAIGQ